MEFVMTRKDTQVAQSEEFANRLAPKIVAVLEEIASIDKEDGYLDKNAAGQIAYGMHQMAFFKRKDIADRVVELEREDQPGGNERRVPGLERLIQAMEAELNDIESVLIPAAEGAYEIITGHEYVHPTKRKAPAKGDPASRAARIEAYKKKYLAA